MCAYRGGSFGKVLFWIGVLIVLVPILFLLFWFGGSPREYILQLSDYIVLAWFLVLGLITSIGGFVIHRRFRDIGFFLIKDGEPMHLGEVWMRGNEKGLFVTSCGLMVSINNESEETAYVGYRIVTAKQATCVDCVKRKGREILDAYNLRREY